MNVDIMTIRELYIRRFSEFGREVGKGAIIALVAHELQVSPDVVQHAILAQSVSARQRG